MINSTTEHSIAEKIKKSFVNEKPLPGLIEKKLIKIYETEKSNINFKDKKLFEDYIVKADLYNTLLRRKKLSYQSIFFILFCIFSYFYTIISQNIFFSFLLLLIGYAFIIYMIIKFLRFFKVRKKFFQKNINK